MKQKRYDSVKSWQITQNDFGGRDDERVNTTCIFSRKLEIMGVSRHYLYLVRKFQASFSYQVEYEMAYSSRHTNVTTYPDLFLPYVNEDLDRLTVDLQNIGLAIISSFNAYDKFATLPPAATPSITPHQPTEAIGPTMVLLPSFPRDPALAQETVMPTSDPAEAPSPADSGPS
jgi:hypothetical protein